MNKQAIQANRLENLNRLIEGWSTKKAFSEATGINNSQLSQLTSGSRPLSDKAARDLESKLELQAGWMDKDNSLPLGYVGIEDAAESTITLIRFLESKGISPAQFDQDVLYRLLKFIFADVTDRGQVTPAQLENLLSLTQA